MFAGYLSMTLRPVLHQPSPYTCFIFYLCFVKPTHQRGGMIDGMEWGRTYGNLATVSLPLESHEFHYSWSSIRFTILNLEYTTYSRIISLAQRIDSHETHSRVQSNTAYDTNTIIASFSHKLENHLSTLYLPLLERLLRPSISLSDPISLRFFF